MKFDLARIWYQPSRHPIAVLLSPLSWLFALCTAIRRWMYRSGILKVHRLNVPVIIVGNISVGGTGKTPFVITLANFLKSQGYRPGIVSRGVGGQKHVLPYWVTPNDLPSHVGDEAILLANHSHCPLVISTNRVAAVNELLKKTNCNIVISDDGLQHYGLGRDMEIAVVDGVRRFGNQYLLPAGPLREPLSRLHRVDFIVVNGGVKTDDYAMTLEPVEFVSVSDPNKKISFQEFPRSKIHAVAGIGHPQRFFNMLQQAGFDLIAHPFPDHHLFQAQELNFTDNNPVLMTEKDAVKCISFANENYWYLRITAKIDSKLEKAILTKLLSSEARNEFENDFAMHSCAAHRHVQHRDDSQ